MPAQAQLPWLLMAPAVSQLSIRGDSRPSRAHAAHLVPLLSNAWGPKFHDGTAAMVVLTALAFEPW